MSDLRMHWLGATFCAMILWTTLARAQQPPLPAAPVSAPTQGPVTATPAAEASHILARDSLTIAALAQVAEMRRSEDRLLSTVLWALGAVVAVALGLAAFSWWSSNTVYKRDLKVIRDENERRVARATSELQLQIESATQRLHSSLGDQIAPAVLAHANRIQAESVSINALTESKLRTKLGDFDGAIGCAMIVHSSALQGNRNYIAHAFDMMTDALEAAERDQVHINTAIVADMRRIVLRHPDFPDDPRAQRVKALLDRL